MKTLPLSRRSRLRAALLSLGKFFLLSLTLTLVLLPGLAEAKKKSHHFYYHSRRAETRLIILQASHLYREMRLQDSGLDEKALEYALLGYHRLLRRHALHRTNVLTVCDFSESSRTKRMYVIDLLNRRVLYRTYVAHGMNSGREYASSFSNRPNSFMSSLGFYITRNAYIGSNGLSLRIDGVERGFNDMARSRNIVIHGAGYVSERILHKYGLMGTSLGCPAVPVDMAAQIIPVLKRGTCFFIYFPSRRYISRSQLING